MEKQLEAAKGRIPLLESRFNETEQEFNVCNDNPDTCTVAEKEIFVLTSENAAAQVQDNARNIAKLEEKIDETKKSLAIKELAYPDIEIAGKKAIEDADKEVVSSQVEYVEARNDQRDVQEELDALNDSCMIKAFHDNQDLLANQRKTLLDYGVRIKVRQTVGEENGLEPERDANDQSLWDCRY